MSRLSVIYHQLRVLPTKVILKKIFRLFGRLVISTGNKIDLSRSTYIHLTEHFGIRQNVFSLPDIAEIYESEKEKLLDIAENILDHRFDILGSGLIKHSYEVCPEGFEGTKYNMSPPVIPYVVEQESESFLSNTLAGYLPIAWNRDFRTGYVWYLDKHGTNIKPAPKYGVDIKNPWELGRMQHLPKLAIAAISMLDTDQGFFARCLSEFKSQIYDFRGSCPPSMGVQWSSAMDVGIRIGNILLAFDFFRSSGHEFDQKFKQDLEDMCREHLLYIIRNPEYAEGQPNNHYFSNLCSVLILSLYLLNDSQSYGLAKWALVNIVREIRRQFNSDGSNFEGSTSYHLFTVEMFLCAIAATNSLTDEEKTMILDTEESSVDYRIVFKDTPEIISDIRFLLMGDESSITEKISQMLTFSSAISDNIDRYPRFGDEDGGSYIDINFSDDTTRRNRHYDVNRDPRSTYSLFFSKNLPEHITKLFRGIKPKSFFEDIGLYSLYNDSVRIWIKNGALGLYGRGGHNHNDNLSFVLYKGGYEIITDPGSYVYTAEPDYRNLFRGTRYHNTPQISSKEINSYGEETEELFWFRTDRSKPTTDLYNEYSYIGSHKGFGRKMNRAFVLSDNSLMIKDECKAKGGMVSRLHFHPQVTIRASDKGVELYISGRRIADISADTELSLDEYWYSSTYGKKERAVMVIARKDIGQINWSISL